MTKTTNTCVQPRGLGLLHVALCLWVLGNVLFFANPSPPRFMCGVRDWAGGVIGFANPFMFGLCGFLGGRFGRLRYAMGYTGVVYVVWHIVPGLWMAAEFGPRMIYVFLLIPYVHHPLFSIFGFASCIGACCVFWAVGRRVYRKSQAQPGTRDSGGAEKPPDECAGCI